MEPSVVAGSRIMPRRMFTSPSLTYRLAAPVEDAMTPIRLAPMASFISMPSPRVRTGMMMMPPPRPNIEPMIPANAAASSTPTVSRRSTPVHGAARRYFLRQRFFTAGGMDGP